MTPDSPIFLALQLYPHRDSVWPEPHWFRLRFIYLRSKSLTRKLSSTADIKSAANSVRLQDARPRNSATQPLRYRTAIHRAKILWLHMYPMFGTISCLPFFCCFLVDFMCLPHLKKEGLLVCVSSGILTGTDLFFQEKIFRFAAVAR